MQSSFIIVTVCLCVAVERQNIPITGSQFVFRDITLDDRYNCSEGDLQPPNRVDTGERVARLRQEMANYGLDAYIINTNDEHQSEYVSDADQRLTYISGFSGSNGQVVITMTQQALWTDGRYFLQADNQLDCNWLLMKSGLEGVPSVLEWIISVVPSGGRVGSDPKIVTANTWMSYDSSLAGAGITLVPESTNLVDIIWTDRPPYSTDPAFVLDMAFAGKTWEQKVGDIQQSLSNDGVDLLVVTALDNVAWLLNLRGNDIPYNPVFRGYIVVGSDRIQLYTPEEKLSEEVLSHLHTNDCDLNICVQIFNYTDIEGSLLSLEDDPAVAKVQVSSQTSSYSIYNAVPSSKRVDKQSPLLNMKAVKNDVEKVGMRNAHVKDAVALCNFLAFMEKEIEAGNFWDELSASNKSEEFRSQQADYFGLSFATISAFGANGAIIHYEPEESTNQPIDTSSLYLLDSGAQFYDGTTDVTRTVHYGTPKPFEIEAYTRVLKGQLDFADIVFPDSSYTSYSKIDILARRPLYEVGLDYRHGTSHGVGMFLYVHEHTNPYFTEGEFMSDEPGYYEDGDFGVRLENVIEVVKVITPYNFSGPSLGFQHTTLVPYEHKLIATALLTPRQCELLNGYHAEVLEVVGQELLNQGSQESYDWLVIKTAPLSC